MHDAPTLRHLVFFASYLLLSFTLHFGEKMAMRLLLFCVLSTLFCTGCFDKQDKNAGSCCVQDIDFDEGLGRTEKVVKSAPDQKRYRTLKKMWEQNRPSHVIASKEGKIPKIIHQIWLGPKRPPRFYFTFRETWEQMHPDWEYRLWTDAEVEAFDFELKDLYNQSANWGEKADILRAEILQVFGGIYVDTDFECLQPFDDLMMRYDFFAGIEPPHAIPESDYSLLISNAIIASGPGHPIMKKWKELIRSRWQKAEEECFSPIEKVLVRTFLTFGEAVESEIEHSAGTNIVFPSTYFYPIKPVYLRHPPKQPNFFKKVLIAFDMKEGHPFSEIKKESMAIHHFAGCWQKKPYELIKDVHKEIVKLKNEQSLMQAEIKTLQEQLKQQSSST